MLNNNHCSMGSKGVSVLRTLNTTSSASLTPLEKQVCKHNKHNDVWKKEQKPRNRFVTILAKQIENPSPEEYVKNLEYEY